jgi:hypothetical protein
LSGKTLLCWGVFLIPFGRRRGYIILRNVRKSRVFRGSSGYIICEGDDEWGIVDREERRHNGSI